MENEELKSVDYSTVSGTGTTATGVTYNEYATVTAPDDATEGYASYIGGMAKDITSKPGSKSLEKEVAEAAINLEKLFKELDTIKADRDKTMKKREKERKIAENRAIKEAKALAAKRKMEIKAIETRQVKDVTEFIKSKSDADLRYALISFLEWEDNHGELMYSRDFKKCMSNTFNLIVASLSKIGTKIESDEVDFDKGYSYKGYRFIRTTGTDGFWRVEDDKAIMFESL